MNIHTIQPTAGGMRAVLVAQFISALADNALLFAAVALLHAHQAPGWQTPLMQEFFVIAFIVLAPFVGPWADTRPKGRVMLFANGLKFIGAASMLAGLQPLLAYGIVGLGAAAYSPAKYGILSELVPPERLIKANGFMEASTIVAILLGAVVGGILADRSAPLALGAIAACYLLAAFANMYIPRLPAAKPQSLILRTVLSDFTQALGALMRNPRARFSLLGTSVFWSAGSTLRLLLVAWVPAVLHISDLSTPANLSGTVAIGIVLGAIAATRFVTLTSVRRTLPAGLLIGLLIISFGWISSLAAAAVLLILIGLCGGFYIVPLNALLQEEGRASVGSGHAVAIQNFVENCCMLLMIGFYLMLSQAGASARAATIAVGILVFILIALLAAHEATKLSNENH